MFWGGLREESLKRRGLDVGYRRWTKVFWDMRVLQTFNDITRDARDWPLY